MTEKQKRLLKLISENISVEKPKSMTQMLLEAGYAESTARQQREILETIEEDLNPIVAKLEEERDAILKELPNKRNKANYGELGRTLDLLVKNAQLLSNKPTENVKHYDSEQIKRAAGEIAND